MARQAAIRRPPRHCQNRNNSQVPFPKQSDESLEPLARIFLRSALACKTMRWLSIVVVSLLAFCLGLAVGTRKEKTSQSAHPVIISPTAPTPTVAVERRSDPTATRLDSRQTSWKL